MGVYKLKRDSVGVPRLYDSDGKEVILQIPSTFHYFSALPRELRSKIWKFAAKPTPRDVRVKVPNMYDEHGFITKKVIFQSLDPVPAILHACKESREEGKKIYVTCLRNEGDNQGRIYINTAVDTLFIDIPMDFQGGFIEALGEMFYVEKPDSPYAGLTFGPKFGPHIHDGDYLGLDLSMYYGVNQEGYNFREFASERQEDSGGEETNGTFDSSVSAPQEQQSQTDTEIAIGDQENGLEQSNGLRPTEADISPWNTQDVRIAFVQYGPKRGVPGDEAEAGYMIMVKEYNALQKLQSRRAMMDDTMQSFSRVGQSWQASCSFLEFRAGWYENWEVLFGFLGQLRQFEDDMARLRGRCGSHYHVIWTWW